jgi:hypothetical protein
MAINSSIQTLKTYVEMMVRYRIWSICGLIVVCSVIWFSQAEASNRVKTVSIIAVMFAVGWVGTIIAVPVLNKQIGQLEVDELKKKSSTNKKW